MEVPASASTDDTCQMLEGKLLELGREPLNVQVVVSEEGNIVLRDDEDIFHKVQDTDESREEGEERHPTFVLIIESSIPSPNVTFSLYLE